MTPELWQRLKPLFHTSLKEDTQNRPAFIDAACGGDLELKMHLEQLLQAERQVTSSLDAPLARLNGFLDDNGARFQAGELVLGRFRIIRPVGRGGMGEVYQAEDLELEIIALKTIRHGIASSSEAFERFRQEVQLARRVSGPQVCRIHELYLLPASGRHQATAFLTMEYLDGITLHEKIRSDGPMPWKQALSIVLEICEGLRLIHEKGIIHRDLKSANIMLCKETGATRIVLMDFGLARDFSADAFKGDRPSPVQRPGKTLPQMIMGTPEYMAPEQFEAKPASPATDIYALGIILYELVTGLHPYAADTPVAAAIRRAKHPLPPSSLRPGVPRRCDRIIERCMEYEPEKRFQSAKEVAKALRAGPANFENLIKDRPWILWFASAMTLALIAGSVFFFWQSRQYYRPSAEALRWYDAGVAALREGNNVKATRSLQASIAQDNHFVMAHARLAEAWANLDFDGYAQRELLVATPGGRHLQPLDRMYLDAIHATVTKDFASEIKIDQQIVDHLPPTLKASAYVDLGMAYERAGDPNHALESYTMAASLDNDSPAPFMHIAVLQSRLHHGPETDRAFQRAQTLLTLEMNEEGLSELDYERGYTANENGNSAEAAKFLQRSLDEASRMQSVQLQIRALTQLSSVASRSDATSAAAKYAERAIQLARENQLDAWAASGLVRLANVQLHQGELQQAEGSLHEALQIAHQSEQFRVEAFANLTLASVMNQRHLPNQVIGPAQSALAYFKTNGYFVPAANASVLLIRTERDKGQYQQALRSGGEFLALASKSGIHELMRQAEELIGSVYLEMEQYPDALVHFQSAMSLADAASWREYEAVNAAGALWRLGRYEESTEMLKFVPENDKISTWVDSERAACLLSRRRYREALSLAREMPGKHLNMVADDQQQFAIDKAIAESHLGMKGQALKDLEKLQNTEKTSGLENAGVRNLAIAEVASSIGLAEKAHEAATNAAASFESTGQLDSELRSVCFVALTAKMLKNTEEYDTFSKKAVDIAAQIEQTWSPQAAQTYILRPDLQTLAQEIPIKVPQSGR